MRVDTCPFPAGSYDTRMSWSRALRAICPASFYMHYIEHVPEFVGNAALKGRGAHQCMGKTAKQCLATGVPMIEEEERNRIFGEVCVEEQLTDPEVLDQVARLYQQFVDAPHLFPQEDGVTQAAEEEFWFLLDRDGIRVAVQCRLDHYKMCGQEFLVNDYKTTERIITSTDFLADMQGPIYVLAGKNRWPKLTDMFVVFDYTARDFLTDPRRITDDDLERAAQFLIRPSLFVRDALALVKAGEKPEDVFPARPGQACHPYEGALCPVIFACKWREKAQIPVIRNDEDARNVMEAIAYREARNKADRQMLKPYVAAGAVKGHGQVALWAEETGWKYDVPGIYKWLSEHGYDPLEYLRVDGVSIRKVRKDLKEAGLVREIKTTSFDIQKEKKT